MWFWVFEYVLWGICLVGWHAPRQLIRWLATESLEWDVADTIFVAFLTVIATGVWPLTLFLIFARFTFEYSFTHRHFERIHDDIIRKDHETAGKTAGKR